MKFHSNIVKKFLINTVISLLLFTSVPAQSKENNNNLYAGIAKINITPEKPVKLAGYSGRADELSIGIHDSLYARAVIFEKSGKTLVLVSTDVIDPLTYFRQDILNEFKLEPSELFITAIHTHSGPKLVIDKEKGHPNNVEYTNSLTPKLIAVIREALNNMKEVEIGAGVGYSPIGINRRELKTDGSGWPPWSDFLVKIGRNPYGAAYKDVVIMRVTDSKHKNTPIALLFDYACHGTCLGDDNFFISGDIFGVAEQFIEKIIGNGIIAPAFIGPSGEINPYMMIETAPFNPPFNPESGWIPEFNLQGTMLGEEVVRTFLDIKENLPVGIIQTDFVTMALPGKEDRTLRNEGTDNLSTSLNITAACIGDVGFVGFGCELATEIGMTIKAASPFQYTFIITHCNGSVGYLVPEHLYREGGYEVETSKFAPGAAEMAIKKALDMLYSF